MRVTLSAEWEEVPLGHRIQIAGYTAGVQETHGVFEYTVLHDHLRIVEVGQRDSLPLAKRAAQIIIQDDIAAQGRVDGDTD